jgi:3-oxoadipate enol-lactonase
MAIAIAEAGEVSLAYEETGPDAPTGEALILIAGGFMDMDQWQLQAHALSSDRRVIRFDQRGNGQSAMPTGGYDIQQFAADTIALIETLNAAPCALFGNSIGGLVALEVAVTKPELVRGLILAATPVGLKGEPMPPETQMTMLRGAALPMEQATAALMDILFETDYPDEHPELLDAAVDKRRAYPAPPLSLMGPLQSALGYDGLEQLKAITLPTLILHGDEDRIVPVGNATLLGDTIPNATVTTIPGVGHALVVEAADAVNEAATVFLATL